MLHFISEHSLRSMLPRDILSQVVGWVGTSSILLRNHCFRFGGILDVYLTKFDLSIFGTASFDRKSLLSCCIWTVEEFPSMSSFDEVFQRALACSSVTNELKLPREKGFWKNFFDQDASQQKYSIPMPPLLDSVSSTDRDPKRQKFEQKAIAETWRHCVKADAELSWTDKREADFQSALKRWLQTLLEMPKTFKVVELLPQQSTVE